MKKFGHLFIFLGIFLFGIKWLYADDAPIINEYFSKKECKEIVDRIIENAGGEVNIKNASSATYEMFINLNLIGLKLSYKQIIKRHNDLYKMEKEVLGEKVITGFDGSELYQSAYGKLFKIPEFKQAEIAFTFHSSLPHQFVLKLKQKDYSLKYLGVQDWSGKKVYAFSHIGLIGEEKHSFDVVSLQPVYSTSFATGLQWEVTRDSFKKQDNLYYPVSIKMKLNQEELYNMTVTTMNFEPLDANEFKKPNQEKLIVVLQPFAGQVRLQEIYKALQLIREFDPVNHSYPLPDKVKGFMGVHPQLGQPTIKIGFKNMFTYELYRGAAAEPLELESYPYILKGNVHKFTPLVWDKKGNYKMGRNVLFADGSIVFLNENQFDSYLQTSLKRYPVIEVEMEK